MQNFRDALNSSNSSIFLYSEVVEVALAFAALDQETAKHWLTDLQVLALAAHAWSSIHSVMIEVRRDLYMNEKTGTKSHNYLPHETIDYYM